MFPSVFSYASTKTNSGPSTNMAAVGHLWFFLLSHLLRNYLMDSMNLSHVILDEFITHAMRTYYICENSSESFTEVKDSHVFVTSVKNSHEFFTAVTNTFEFFTLVTDSFDFYIRTNLSHVWRIRTYLSHMRKIRTNSSQVWQIRANSSHV